ncbi:glyoxalase [Mycolicibacterium madagascariense]|uniref:Glyoxalase n=1 Tax=Mycolicibacterium madagascariense TaxID=212765 RepID=A0A7I7XBA5_9MYCO|nr:VOC family protein [Mycolicibacterium madagascariense]MCV7014875.1 VOC family protein [Mycolicibacterium madagascariense]BBZ26585.1 glyoxalase [Mycolicibacterium madagascariense]
MTAPPVLGLHHLKVPVADLDAGLAWYERILGATHLSRFDHVDRHGQRYAVIVGVPGLDTPVELRWAPAAATAAAGYDPINLAVASVDDLHAWAEHLDAEGVAHSGVVTGGAGHLLVFADPDGMFLRLADVPSGGVEDITMPQGDPEPDDPWLSPPSMRHPGPAAPLPS